MLKELFRQKPAKPLFSAGEIKAAVDAFRPFNDFEARKLFRDNDRKSVNIEPLIRSLTALAERVKELEARVAELEKR